MRVSSSLTATAWMSTIVSLLLFRKSQGAISIQGCTEAFVRMTCPNDDLLMIRDVRFALEEGGKGCKQQKPAQSVTVPQEVMHLCKDTANPLEGHTCLYAENICSGKTDCAFYVSPHLIRGREQPTENSQVLIEYECQKGPSQKGGVVVVGLLGAVGTLCIALIGGLLIWRMAPSPEGNFHNESAQPTRRAAEMSFANPAAVTSPAVTGGLTSQTQPRPGQHPQSGAPLQCISDEHISVELQAAAIVPPESMPGAGEGY